jgi:hypothetical protein
VRLAPVPFVFRLADLPALAPGRRILVEILGRDELELGLSARFVELIEGADDASGAQEAWLAEETAAEAAEGSDEQAEALASGAAVADADAAVADAAPGATLTASDPPALGMAPAPPSGGS